MSDGESTGFFQRFSEGLAKLAHSTEISKISERIKLQESKWVDVKDVPDLNTLTSTGLVNSVIGAALHGMFMAMWSDFELMVEIIIMRLSEMDEETNSIVCAPIQIGIKMQIALSLINKNSKDEIGTELLRAAQNAASRNAYVHGLWIVDDSRDNIFLYNRETKNQYTVKKRDKNWNDHAHHIVDCFNAFRAVQAHFKIRDSDLVNYKKSLVKKERENESLETLHQQ